MWRTLLLLLALSLALLPGVARADGEDEGDEPDAASSAVVVEAIAAYYGLEVAEVSALHEAGIGYGLLFKLAAMVQRGEVTTEELLAWRSGESARGWGVWLKMARSEAGRGQNLGQAMRSYQQSRRAERGAAGPPADAGQGQGQGQGQGNGNAGAPPGLSNNPPGQNNGSAPGSAGNPGNDNGRGNGGSPPGLSGSNPGHGGSPPGQAGKPPKPNKDK